MMNKKGWLLRDFVVAGIIFGAIIALYIFQVASVAENYDNKDMISPAFSEHYNTLTQSMSKLNTANSAVQGEGGLTLLGTFDIAFNSIFSVVAMVWDMIKIYTGMTSNMVSDFPFLSSGPFTVFLLMVSGIITAYIIFVWMSSVSRGKI